MYRKGFHHLLATGDTREPSGGSQWCLIILHESRQNRKILGVPQYLYHQKKPAKSRFQSRRKLDISKKLFLKASLGSSLTPQSLADEMASEPPALAGAAPAALSVRSVSKRVWSDDKRAAHRQACKDKEKLSLGQKLEIVRRSTAASGEEYRSQAQLAQMFNKSRSAISKILRPDNVKRLRQAAATGMHPDVKRHSWRDSSEQFLELEKRVHVHVLAVTKEDGSVCHTQVCQYAEKVAAQIGVPSFKATYGWFTRFLRRHGLSAGTRTLPASAAGPPSLCGTAAPADVKQEAPDSADCEHSAARNASSPESCEVPSELSSGGSFDSSASTQPDGTGRVLESTARPDWYGGYAAHSAHGAQGHGDGGPALSVASVPHRSPGMQPLDGIAQDWQPYMSFYGKLMLNVKAVYRPPLAPESAMVSRRLRFPVPLQPGGAPVDAYKMIVSMVLGAYHAELNYAAAHGFVEYPHMMYLDQEGDPISINSDHEVAVALGHAQSGARAGAELTLRLHITHPVPALGR